MNIRRCCCYWIRRDGPGPTKAHVVLLDGSVVEVDYLSHDAYQVIAEWQTITDLDGLAGDAAVGQRIRALMRLVVSVDTVGDEDRKRALVMLKVHSRTNRGKSCTRATLHEWC